MTGVPQNRPAAQFDADYVAGCRMPSFDEITASDRAFQEAAAMSSRQLLAAIQRYRLGRRR